MPEWSDLKIVLALSRSGTMSGAAKHLRVDHSTIGRRLSSIEDSLGTKLFKRTPRRMVPTETGNAAIAAAESMEQAVAALERRINSKRKALEGLVKLTTSEGFAGLVVAGLPGLRERHPKLQVEIITSNAPLDLTSGEADIAIRLTDTPQQGLIVKRLVDVEWGVYASTSYLDANPLGEPASLRGHSLLAFDRRLGRSPGGLWAEQHAAEGQIVMRGNSINAVRAATVAGLGLAGLPRFVAEQQGLAVALPDTIGVWPCSLVFHADLKDTPRIRAVIDYFADYLRERACELHFRMAHHAQGDT